MYSETQPRVPAGGPDGGQFASTGASAAASEMADAMKESGPEYDYGIRVVAKDHDNYEGLSKGDELPDSSVWVNGDYTDESAGGTSVVEIQGSGQPAVMKALKVAGATGEKGPNGYYFGDKVVLVRGIRRHAGEDIGEAVFKEAEVVGVWRKPSQGMTEVGPNGG